MKFLTYLSLFGFPLSVFGGATAIVCVASYFNDRIVDGPRWMIFFGFSLMALGLGIACLRYYHKHAYLIRRQSQ